MSETTAPVVDGQGSAPASSSAALATPAAAAPPAASASAQITPPAPPQQPTAQIPWLDGADETTLGYAANKGWSDPKQVLDSYRNLEKLLGADKANNAVILPKEGADPKEYLAIFDRLGRPTGPDGYKVEVPAGGDPNLQSQMLAKAHELGLTKAQAEGLFSEFNAKTVSALQSAEAEKAANFAREDAAIRQEWGQAYTQNLAAAQAAARGLGLDNDTIDKMSEALGHKGTMALLHKIGTRMEEPGFVAGDNTERFGSAMTPGQAKAEIQTLMQDKGFTAKLMAKDAEANAKWTRLHQFAYPE